MAANPPKRPKLRTSCDQCGAAKVKCDRGQPDCARCVSHGRTCVYGVSRKMGKPPRVKLRCPSPSRSPGAVVRKIESSLGDRGTAAAAFGHPTAGVADAWDTMDENAACVGLDALDGLFNDLNGHFSPHSPGLNLGEWACTDQFGHHLSSHLTLGTFPTPEPTEWGSYTSTEASTAQATAHQSPSDASPHSDRAAMTNLGFGGHDCPRAAYDILRNLSFPNNTTHSTSSLTSASASSSLHMGNQVPLDHVLRLNSEASERLGPLLSCPCARSPHLAFLYASIISRVLLWYQQAAGYTHSTPWTHPAPDYPSGSEHITGPYTTGMAVAPAKMAIGSFNVDDLRIQTALKIQLLSGEMGRASRLIDQFTSLSCGGLDEARSDSVDRLYQSLHSWLRGEHSRIANTMRLKLRELNT